MVSVRTRPLLIALVAILALALAAATLNSAVVHEGAAGGGGGGFGQGGGGEGGSADDSSDPSSFGFSGFGGSIPVIPFPCFPILNELWFLASVAAVALIGLYVLYRRKGPLVPIGVVAAVAPPALLIHVLLTACRAADDPRISLPGGPESNTSSAFSFTGGTGGAGEAAGGTPIVSIALFVVLGLVLLVAVALLFYSTGDDQPPARDKTDEPPDPVRMAAIGRAAGRAADRIEADTEPDNAVYLAWKEMTDLLEVPNSEASTPAEFADAAVDAGLAADDVAEITALFETVRYGTADPTKDREERALAALRRIEDEYAGEAS